MATGKLDRTGTPGVYRRHTARCEGGRCGCPYVVVYRHRGAQHAETYRTAAEAGEGLRLALQQSSFNAVGHIRFARPVLNPDQRRSVSTAMRRRILARDGTTCRCCGSTDDPQIDHIVPVVAGGRDEDANLQVLCGACNRAKGSTLVEEAA